jgi:hypothetical protein
VLVEARSALAQSITGPRPGFRMRLDSAGLQVCVVRPLSLYDETACKAMLEDTALEGLKRLKGLEFALAI